MCHPPCGEACKNQAFGWFWEENVRYLGVGVELEPVHRQNKSEKICIKIIKYETEPKLTLWRAIYEKPVLHVNPYIKPPKPDFVRKIFATPTADLLQTVNRSYVPGV